MTGEEEVFPKKEEKHHNLAVKKKIRFPAHA